MSHQTHEQYSVESILSAIANWVERYRNAVGLRGELARCRPEEVASMARDIGVSPQELKFFVKKGPRAADELPKLLRALGVDPQKLASDDQNKMRDLQRLCITCGDKNQCRHDLAAGTAASRYNDYCPNAASIRAIFQSSSETG
jgi:uncharacterized protein DUF6455